MGRELLHTCAGLICLGFTSLLPATVQAQCPTYLTKWGSSGRGEGQFSTPLGVATAAAGDV